MVLWRRRSLPYLCTFLSYRIFIIRSKTPYLKCLSYFKSYSVFYCFGVYLVIVVTQVVTQVIKVDGYGKHYRERIREVNQDWH